MIHLGRHSYCYGVQRGTANDVHVGNFTSIAEGVIFDGGFNHHTYNVTTFPLHRIWSEIESNINCKGDITVGSDVWIGEDAIIMSGITIGDGAIVGARAVVTKDVKPYTVVGGVPAKKIRDRFYQTSAASMLKIKWWEWDDERIKKNIDLGLFSNKTHITTFIHKHV